MRRWLVLILIVFALPVAGQAPPQAIESITAEIERLQTERKNLSERLSSIENSLRELVTQRNHILFEQSAKDGIFIENDIPAPLRKEPSALAEVIRETALRAVVTCELQIRSPLRTGVVALARSC